MTDYEAVRTLIVWAPIAIAAVLATGLVLFGAVQLWARRRAAGRRAQLGPRFVDTRY